jgi:hypothetical protein
LVAYVAPAANISLVRFLYPSSFVWKAFNDFVYFVLHLKDDILFYFLSFPVIQWMTALSSLIRHHRMVEKDFVDEEEEKRRSIICIH